MTQLKHKNNYFLKGLLFLLIVFAFSMFWKTEDASALNTCSTGWQVNAGAEREVDCHGVCKIVKNNGSISVFVPTNVSAEWLQFRSNRPTTIQLSECCDCTTGACCDGCNYRPSSYVCDTWTEYDYRCTGTACGNDAQNQSRTNTQKCTGSSASCSGSITYGTWSSWSTTENCASTEKCATDNSSYAYCYYASECDTPTTYTLSVNSSGASGVSITGNPTTYSGTTNYSKTSITSGTSLTLTAPATSGSYNFSSWTGCNSVSGTGDRICNLTMSSNKTVTATFNTSGTWGGCSAGLCVITDPPYAGAMVNINEAIVWKVVNPPSGVSFSWSGDCSGTGLICSKSFSSPNKYTSQACYGSTCSSAMAGVCDYGNYCSSASNAYNLGVITGNGSESKNYMCGKTNYYKITIPSNYECDLEWKIEVPTPFGSWWLETHAAYTIYTKWTPGSGEPTSCGKVVNSGTGSCTQTNLTEGTYYARIYDGVGRTDNRPEKYYKITATLKNCEYWYPNDPNKSSCTLGGDGSCTDTYCNTCNSGSGAGKYLKRDDAVYCPGGDYAVTGKCIAKNDEDCGNSRITSNGKGWHCNFNNCAGWLCISDGCAWVKCKD